ncbi:MAG TPA: DNA recombination protein RmuC [Actinomycetota bacterium]|nr:DNA recombination protein RmuC [Actinomycetota bacterium]
METIGYVAVALAVGAAVGGVLGLLARRPAATAADPGALAGRLEVQAAELRRLADAAAVRGGEAEHLPREMGAARSALERLAVREEERRERERESWEVVHRLSTVLAGGVAQGRAGENVLRDHLAQLPPGMLVTDLRINGRVVEFALELPDGRRLPVDSKWTAVAELQALEACTDHAEREHAARAVERQVVARAREVAQYLDPAATAPVAVAAIPDAAYAVLRRAHADAFARGVVIVPYSTALPVLLFLYSLVHRFGGADDARVALAEVASILDALDGVVENKVARAATMLANAAEEMRSGLGKARGSVARGRSAAPAGGAPERPGVLEVVGGP